MAFMNDKRAHLVALTVTTAVVIVVGLGTVWPATLVVVPIGACYFGIYLMTAGGN